MSGVTVMAVVVASCSGSSGSGWSGSAATTGSAHAGADDVRAATEAAPTAEAVEAAECSPRRASRQRDTGPLQHGRWISLDGAMVGTGTVGVGDDARV